MFLREMANADDAKMSIAVFRHWREEAGIEDESELISGVSVQQRNAAQVIRVTLRDIISERGVASMNDLLYRTASKGITEYQVEDMISKMLQSGELFSPRNDEYSFAR